jgi:murein DD-endopeptidase MepM/ murein hydrolase activator NlpD
MWINPTGGTIRKCDAKGCAHYGESRGNRIQAGVDFIAKPEQEVKAVRGGTVTVVGYVYSDDLSFRYIAIKTNDNNIVRHLYIKPSQHIYPGAQVKDGEVIGTYQRLGIRYPGITEHIHVDVWEDDGTLTPWSSGANSIDPSPFIPKPLVSFPLLGNSAMSISLIAVTLFVISVSVHVV